MEVDVFERFEALEEKLDLIMEKLGVSDEAIDEGEEGEVSADEVQ